MPTKAKKAIVTESIPPKIVKISEDLSCDLNQVEWENRARELADAYRESEQMENRKKSITAELNADLKIAKARESKLAAIVATRSEMRDVTVKIVYDYDSGMVTKVRTDTEEEISHREMTDNERQVELIDANAFIADRHEDEQTEDVLPEDE